MYAFMCAVLHVRMYILVSIRASIVCVHTYVSMFVYISVY